MFPFFSTSAQAYTGDSSESSTRATVTMRADGSGGIADADDDHAPMAVPNAYGAPGQQQPRVVIPSPPPFDFEPDHPLAGMDEELQRILNAPNATQMMQGPGPSALTYQAQLPYNQLVFANGFGGRSYEMFVASMQNAGYAGFPLPPIFYTPPPEAISSTQHAVDVSHYALPSLGDGLPGAGAVDPQRMDSPPPRGRTGTPRTTAAGAGKDKQVQPSAAAGSPVAGPSRLDDDAEDVLRRWFDPDALNSILTSSSLQSGVQHTPRAPVQDYSANGGQSQGSSTSGQAAAPRSRAARTAPGVTKDAPRDKQGRLQIHAPVANPQPPVKGKAIPVFEPAPLGKTQYCHECWEAGDVVYWQDNAGMAKHGRDKHNEKRGASRVPHQCIFECGFFKCSTLAAQFVKHRRTPSGGKTYCKPYHELEANGGVEEFLAQRNLQGHWQLGRAKKGGMQQADEEEEEMDAELED